MSTSGDLTAFICRACGTQYAPSRRPPPQCRICSDDRQYVAWAGQRWTTQQELGVSHEPRIEHDGDLLGVGIAPLFAIPQRALFIQTDAGNVLWDCISLLTPAIVDELDRRGGVDLIAISHPHFYSSMVDWSEAFGNVPVLLHADDRDWISRPSPNIELWSGPTNRLSDSVTLYHCPGHFPGSTLLHWADGPGGHEVVLAGDTLHVAQDRRHVSFVYSVPNHLPLGGPTVLELRRRLADLQFDDVYGFTWGLNILGDARRAVDESFDRHLRAVTV